MRNHYSTLGLTSKASQNEVVVAYKKLAKKFHPDRNPSETAKEKFIELHEAYSTLKDPQRRALYDRSLTVKRTAGNPSHVAAEHFHDLVDETSKMNVKNTFGVSVVIAGSFLGVLMTALVGAIVIALPLLLCVFISIGTIPQRMFALVCVAIPYWYALYRIFLKKK
jgi:hypothetical protein